jgi:hypothetical protein
MDELKIKVKAKKVFSKSSDYLPSLETAMFATKEELETNEHVYLSFQGNEVYQSEAQIIPISAIKQLIEEAEASGANFVTIDFHVDHLEYDVYGFLVEKMTDAEIKVIEALKAKKEKEFKEQQIKRLEEKIQKLKEE